MGRAYSSSSGSADRPSAESRGVAPNIAQHRANGVAGGVVDRLIQRGDRQRLPQQLDETRRLRVPLQPLAHRLAWRIGVPARPRACACRSERQCDRANRARSIVMRRPAGAAAPASGGHAKRDAGPLCRSRRWPDRAGRNTCDSVADAPEKAKRLVIAAEEHVLAVVDALAGGGIGERRRTPAQRRPRLEHEHARATLGQRGGGAEAGEAGADDDDVGASASSQSASSARGAAQSARGAGAARECAS